MNQPQDPSLPVPASYEAAVSELEKLVSRMESDQLPLEELLAGYQRGQFLLDFCRERLAEVETHLQRLEEDRTKGGKA
jgi:exodeoxyribonuclease VII small subunit